MVALPSGTVTFLFTDVEGSTRLMERYPEAYRHAISQHHAIVSRAVEENAGAVFETLGDAVYSAFWSPREAVTAALAAQQGFRDASWDEIGALRVRMGLHTGEVERVGAHYFGPPSSLRPAGQCGARRAGAALVGHGRARARGAGRRRRPARPRRAPAQGLATTRAHLPAGGAGNGRRFSGPSNVGELS